jgi:hypothetical protein
MRLSRNRRREEGVDMNNVGRKRLNSKPSDGKLDFNANRAFERGNQDEMMNLLLAVGDG